MLRAWAALAILIPCAASASMTGEDLLRACSAPEESVEHHDCGAYVQGTIDGSSATTKSLAFASGGDGAPTRLFCIGREEPPENVVVAVTRYLQNHPENRASSAASNTLLAVIDAYPCPKAGVSNEATSDRRDAERDSNSKR